MIQNLCKTSKRSCHFLAVNKNCCKITESEASNNSPEIGSTDLELIKTYLEFVDSSIIDKKMPFCDTKSPMEFSIIFGEAELVKIIARYSDHLNTPDRHGWVPLKRACLTFRFDIAKILAPLTRDPLSPTSKSVLIPSSYREMSWIAINYNHIITSE